MTFVVATWLALLAGPLLIRLVGPRRGLIALLDGFVLASIVGLVIGHLLPQSLELAGGWAALAAVVGVSLPPLVEHTLERARGPWHGLMLLVGMAGLAVHAMLDGAGIASEADEGGGMLTLGVLLHRVPMGLSVWWVVRPRAGRGAALIVLLVLAVGTSVGFLGARPLLDRLPLGGLAAFQALVAGSLVHVVVGHEPEALVKLSRRRRGHASLGALLGAAMVLALGLVHDESNGVFGSVLVSLAVASAPALLAAFAAAGLIHALAPPAAPLPGRGAPRQAIHGIVLGVRTPLCACDVLPFYRQLLARAVSPIASMAFLVAAPSLALEAVLVGVPLLGLELAAARVVCAVLLAWLAGLLVGARAPEPAAPPAELAPPHSHGGRFVEGLRHGFVELADHALPWFAAGLAIAALCAPLIERRHLESIPSTVAIVALALFGLAGHVTAAALMPLITVLMERGLGPGAALALLLVAPVTGSVSLAGMAKVHGRATAVAFAALLSGGAIACGLAAQTWLPNPDITLSTRASPLEWLALAALVALLGASLLRQGPRALVGRVLDPHETQLRHVHSHSH